MNLHIIRDPGAMPDWMGEALERFERGFTYPLGSGRIFRISHGREYLPFFAAMGSYKLLVAEDKQEVLGTLVCVMRRIDFGGPYQLERWVHYLADLKISPRARGGMVLASLMHAAKELIETSGSSSCYGIVMKGTASLPPAYTGRLGIPAFEKLADIMVLRISPGTAGGPVSSYATVVPEPVVPESQTTCIVSGGHREQRSLMRPLPLPGGAWLEDTRRAKRLWTGTGEEMLSAHLTSFQFIDPAEGAAVIRAAVAELHGLGFPALFTAVPASRYPALRAELRALDITEAPAAVFGHELPGDCDWWVDTAEI